jgi:hypothetical protein
MRKLFFVSLIVGAGAIGRTAPAEIGPAALADFFKPGVVWQDRNGDGAIDFVDARIVLPEQPTSAELAAAADVAARLGFETSAMNIPVVRLTASAKASAVRRSFSEGGKPRATDFPTRST